MRKYKNLVVILGIFGLLSGLGYGKLKDIDTSKVFEGTPIKTTYRELKRTPKIQKKRAISIEKKKKKARTPHKRISKKRAKGSKKLKAKAIRKKMKAKSVAKTKKLKSRMSPNEVKWKRQTRVVFDPEDEQPLMNAPKISVQPQGWTVQEQAVDLSAINKSVYRRNRSEKSEIPVKVVGKKQ